jgi:Cu-processing system permease protein
VRHRGPPPVASANRTRSSRRPAKDQATTIVFLSSVLLTAVFLSLTSLIAAGAVGRRRSRALALALVVWFVAIVLFDVAALGLASLLRSGPASRVLIRTGALLGLQGTTAFGSASLAFLRFTKGPVGAACLLSLSVLLWIAVPFAAATRRLGKADL